MSIADIFKKRKEEKEQTLEEAYRDVLKINTLRVYTNSPNKIVAETIANKLKKDSNKVLKVLDSFGDNKWWFSTEAEVLAVQQLKIGRENLIIYPTNLSAAVFCVTGKLLNHDKILEDWDSLWVEVQEKLGEDKIKDITYTEEDWQREYDDAMRIDW